MQDVRVAHLFLGWVGSIGYHPVELIPHSFSCDSGRSGFEVLYASHASRKDVV
jgi:hypothetical protein